jgi:hypothetical protein
MELSVTETSLLASKAAVARNQNPNYVNPFLKRADGSSVSSDRAKTGNHQYLKRTDGTSLSSDRVCAGTHNFVTNHPNKKQVTCPHCNLTGGKANMNRFHFNNCWSNPNRSEIKRETFTCDHCGIVTNKGNYNRWHGAACKSLFPT